MTRTIKFCTNFVPPSHRGLTWNLVSITQWFLRVTGWATSRGNLSSGVCDQVRLKPVCSADETSYVLKFQTIASRDIKLSRQRKTKALIRLRSCTGWSAPLLFANCINRFSHDVAQDDNWWTEHRETCLYFRLRRAIKLQIAVTLQGGWSATELLSQWVKWVLNTHFPKWYR